MKVSWFARMLILSVCMVAVGCAAAPPIPAALRVPEGQDLLIKLRAKGVQIYECQPKGDPSQFEWVFKQPEATLFTNGGKNFGRHYAGPTWEDNGGGKVVGEVLAHLESPNPNSISLLLLRAKSNSGGGAFASARSIQRLNTVGGNPPAVRCRQEQSGQQVRASYTADYLFYGVKR